MYREGVVARDDQRPEQPGQDGDDSAGDERDVHEVQAEQLGEHHPPTAASRWCAASGTPTMTIRFIYCAL